MIVNLRKVVKFNMGNYESAEVSAGATIDDQIDTLPEGTSVDDHLNLIVDAILRPEVDKLYDVINDGQDSFLIDYKKGTESGD